MKRIFFNYKKILTIFLIILIMLFIGIIVFLKLYLPFGGDSSNEDKVDYANRSNNYKDDRFYNENKNQIIYEDYYEHSFISNKDMIPIDKIPIEKTLIKEVTCDDVLNFAWLGHSSLLIQIEKMNILIDPMFSNSPSPVGFVGTERFSEVPVNVNELPNIDIVIISNDHYDHLDYQTIKDIDKVVKKYIVPLGVENHLEKWGVDKSKIINMAWWEEIEVNNLLIGCTPTRHNSGRKIIDNNKTLWASWVLLNKDYKIFVSGDTGYDNHFQKINNKYGGFDIVFLDSGQYDRRWKDLHMTPEEAVNAGIILQSKVMMPIHWGTFKLARHPWDDPVERFIKKAKDKNVRYITPKIGQMITYQENIQTDNWWTSIQ